MIGVINIQNAETLLVLDSKQVAASLKVEAPRKPRSCLAQGASPYAAMHAGGEDF